ncbi:MAG: galactokinase [Anaerolineae bacterium]|nr:galactokinase [Anaerolineae bacterium]
MPTSLLDTVLQAFRARFLKMPDFVVRAPGAVTLSGEHTDYNEGSVLSLAVDRAAWLAVGMRRTREAVVRALDMGGDEVLFPVDRVAASAGGWADYPRAIAWAFLQHNVNLPGMDAVLVSDVPVGAGMSSSSAVELVFAQAWNLLGGLSFSPADLALLAQHAECDYVGGNCGVVDQMASACAREDHVQLLDTRTLERMHVPFPDTLCLAIVDSRVRWFSSVSEYNVRRAQCEHAVRLLQRSGLEGIRALRDVTPDDLERYGDVLPDTLYRRVRHVIGEQQRVQAAADCLKRGDLSGIGHVLMDTHRSLRDDFEVSVPELDALVVDLAEVPGCYGVHLTGEGLGGSLIALVEKTAVATLEERVMQKWQEFSEHNLEIHVVVPAGGVTVAA